MLCHRFTFQIFQQSLTIRGKIPFGVKCRKIVNCIVQITVVLFLWIINRKLHNEFELKLNFKESFKVHVKCKKGKHLTFILNILKNFVVAEKLSDVFLL